MLHGPEMVVAGAGPLLHYRGHAEVSIMGDRLRAMAQSVDEGRVPMEGVIFVSAGDWLFNLGADGSLPPEETIRFLLRATMNALEAEIHNRSVGYDHSVFRPDIGK